MSKIIFMGSPALAVPCLEALSGAGDSEVVAVLAQPDRPVGRGRKMQPCAVKTAAVEKGISVHTPVKAASPEAQELVRAIGADLAIVCAYGHILPQSLLDLFPLGCFNLHFSLLPRWRGASPVQAAILNGDRDTGVSLQQMVLELDAGPIVAETPLMPIGDRETAGELAPRLAQAAASLLIETLPALLSGGVSSREQIHDQATFCRTIKKQAGRVDFQVESAQEIDRKARAYAPWPGCFAFVGQRRLGLTRLEPATPPEGEAAQTQAPGMLTAEGLVRAREGWVRLVEVKPEGKRAMPWADFERGNPAVIGQVLHSKP